MKTCSFSAMDVLCGDIFYGYPLKRDVFLVVCQVLYAKVAGASSNEGFLVLLYNVPMLKHLLSLLLFFSNCTSA